jgi:hypothetical protein
MLFVGILKNHHGISDKSCFFNNRFLYGGKDLKTYKTCLDFLMKNHKQQDGDIDAIKKHDHSLNACKKGPVV